MSDFPEAMSMADLMALQETAKSDETDKLAGPYGGYTKEQVIDIVSDMLEELTDKIKHPIAPKVAMHMIVDHMIDWHTNASVQMIEDGNGRHAVCWARDAGKFQALANILQTISVANDDFTCSD